MTKPCVHRYSHQAMGTFFEVTIAGEEESYAAQAAQAVFREIERAENLFSRFNSTSEISRINRLMPGESLLVGVDTFECLTAARKLRVETDGAFDINFRSRTLASESRGLPPTLPSSSIVNTATGTEFKKIMRMSPDFSPKDLIPFPLELIRTNNGFEVKFEEHRDEAPTSLAIDLGGIGKGYALDKALGVLADWSIENALIHAGTSTAIAIGFASRNSPAYHVIDQVQNEKSDFKQSHNASPDKEGWPVGVGGGWPCPDAPRQIWLSGRAVSGSGTEVKGKHIIDPRTGGPANEHVAAWASHPSAAIADALSTAFMVMSTVEVEDYCRRHPDVWALVVRDYGDCRMFGSIDR